MIADIQQPSFLKVGGGAHTELVDLLATLDVCNPFIIADPIMLQLGLVEKIKALLQAADMPSSAFCDVMPEPNDLSIAGAVEQVRAAQADCLIAIGGGSAIDSAKAIALLASHGGHMREYKVPHVVNQQSIPVIAIPTTAGTGSECTRVTVISDSQSHEKMLCMGPGLMPKAAIIDYELTLTVPFRVAADTGLDALTHAIEAWASKKANPFSDQYAIAALRLIAPNLLAACRTPENHQAKAAVMLGATYAGMAFSNASVALVHGMSRPLGVHFHVPHGMSNAMLLPAITQYSLAGAPQRYAECACHMGIVPADTGIEECHTALIQCLTMLNHELQVPKMSGFGIEQSRYGQLIDTMADQALASGSPANNPIVPDKLALTALYQQVYE